MAHHIFPTAKEVSACKVKLESNADCIFYREGIVHCVFVLEGRLCILLTMLRLVSHLWDKVRRKQCRKMV